MDPLPEVNAAGRGRPKFIALAGIWLVFALQIPLLVLGIALILSNIVPPADVDWFAFISSGRPTVAAGGQRAVEYVSLFVAIGLVAGNVVILWKATARYRAGRRAARRRRFSQCEQCGYDLRGTIAADRDTCPECGTTRQVEAPPGSTVTPAGIAPK